MDNVNITWNSVKYRVNHPRFLEIMKDELFKKRMAAPIDIEKTKKTNKDLLEQFRPRTKKEKKETKIKKDSNTDPDKGPIVLGLGKKRLSKALKQLLKKHNFT